jgi:hypothetical protein
VLTGGFVLAVVVGLLCRARFLHRVREIQVRIVTTVQRLVTFEAVLLACTHGSIEVGGRGSRSDCFQAAGKHSVDTWPTRQDLSLRGGVIRDGGTRR